MRECFPRLSIASVDSMQYLSVVVFSALVGFSLHTTSTHHRVKQSPISRPTTRMSSVAYVMLCGARDRSCGQQAIYASITIMLQHIISSLFRFCVRKTRIMWFARLPVTAGYQVMPVLFHLKIGYFSNNENPTRALNTMSLKCCLSSTDVIDMRKKFTHASAFHWNLPGFRKKEM